MAKQFEHTEGPFVVESRGDRVAIRVEDLGLWVFTTFPGVVQKGDNIPERERDHAQQKTNAERAVACINACDSAGLGNGFLDSGGLVRMVQALATAVRESDQLGSEGPAIAVLVEIKDEIS